MSRTLQRSLSFAVSVSAALLIGAKPAPAPKAFYPAVAYRYLGNAGQELRLADASGSAAVLLYRSSGYLSGFDLAPASKNEAVFIDSPSGAGSYRLMLQSWTQDSPGGALTAAPPRLLYQANTLLYPDYSPDGSKVAFDDWDGTGTLYSLRIVDVATGAVTTVASGVEGPAYLRWSSTGDALYYASQHPVTGASYTSAYTAYRQPVAGGPPEFQFERPNIERWDISRDGSDSLILNYSAPDTTGIPFAVWNRTSLTQVYPQLIGVAPHYACGNARLIYQSYSRSGVRGPVKVFTPPTSDEIYTRDNNVRDADWIPCG